MKVHRLDETTITKIAAGEVVERPASVVKELVENAIDAGATQIEVEIRNGGRQLIRITDNGSGMDREDAVLALERHTTSKISSSDDLWNLNTLGFRGEALPSIAVVSQFQMITRPTDQELGTSIEVRGGMLQKVKDCGAPVGTTIKVQDLFFNTPARLKYLKSIPTEANHISDIIARLALGYPGISFRLQHHEYEVLFSPGTGDHLETIGAVFSRDNAKEMISLSYQEDNYKITGYIGKPTVAKTNRNHEVFFINHRYFNNRIISAAVEKAYHSLLPIARYPFVILFLEVDPSLVDINVHPSKMEVKFANDNQLYKIVFHAIRKQLKDSCLLSEWIAPEEDLTLKNMPVEPAPTPPPTTQNLNFKYTDYQEVSATTTNQVSVVNEPPPEVTYTVPPLVVSVSAAPKPESQGLDFYVFPKAVRNTYIIAQDEKGLLIIDQHAAHERILFERFMNRTKEFLGAQALLIPETITLSHPQYRVVSERLTLFSDLGFDLEVFGGQTVILRSVPLSLVNLDYQQIIYDLTEQFINFGTFKNPAEIKEEFIVTMSCRTAIKAGDNLNHLELEGLVKDLFKCENPYTCPHGRPTIFRMSIEEVAKKFLRR